MLTSFLKILGWILAHTPEPLLAGFSAVVGTFIHTAIPRRRRLLHSNLSHAFPERSAAWIHRTARLSCRRLVETGLLSIASPYLSEARLRRIGRLHPDAVRLLDENLASPRGAVLGSLHFAYWETQTWLGLLSPATRGKIAAIYRPLDHPTLDAFVQRTRSRFGMTLFSRKEGFVQAMRMLKQRGSVGVLFDQNAGMQGALTTLMGRVCSTTELPGIMAEKTGSDLQVIYPRRLGFWRVQIEMERVPFDGTAEDATIALNRRLEEKLRGDEDLCASWLWSHDRWRNQDMPTKRLRLELKRDLLAHELQARGWSQLPRATRFFIRLPNWLGDVVMVIPLLRAIRRSRPDAELTLIGKGGFRELLELAGVADHFVPLPPRGLTYWTFFRSLRHRHPDCYLLFTNSFRGDLEAWLTGTRQRFGILRPGKRRPLLSRTFSVPPHFHEHDVHQLELWTQFLQHFGLNAPPDLSPLVRPPERSSEGPHRPIGLIAGSENLPAKRWPVAHWRALIDAFPTEHFVLFGTPGDRTITAQVAQGFESSRVEDVAGKTDLRSFSARLGECRLLVTNDTGGMHLANALGVPLVVLFGPTNPVRTGPVFSGPSRVLQPPGCPRQGGSALETLSPETVIASVRTLLAENARLD